MKPNAFKVFKKSFYQDPTDKKIEGYLDEIKFMSAFTYFNIDLNILHKYKLSKHYSVIDILYYNALILNILCCRSSDKFDLEKIKKAYFNYDLTKVDSEIEIYILKKICIDYFDTMDERSMVIYNHYIHGEKMPDPYPRFIKVYLG